MAYTSPRKQARGRRHLPDVPVDSPRLKAVSFSSDVVETSIGGTQTVAKMKGDPLAPVTGSRNLASQTQSGVASQSQSGNGGNVISSKGVTPACQTRQAKGQELGEEAENKENVETTEEARTPRNKAAQQKPGVDDDAVFASPVGRPAKAALLIREFEKFTPTKPKSDTSVRRTTQEYLDQVPDSFVTPPQRQLRRHTLETKVFETPDCYRAVQMGTPRKSYLDLVPETDDSMTETDGDGAEDSCSIMVAVRVRPYSQRELSDPNVKRVVSMAGNETTVTTDSGSVHRFAFDFSFWSFDQDNGDFADQGQVYGSLAQPLLGKAFEGYNTCLFAYGQTGSGKSYSIMGHGQDTGIIPRFCEELFSRAVKASNKDKVKISVEISFFEIYNEKIHDLLASSKEKNGKKATLKVREHPVLGPYVEGLSTFVVNSFEDVEGWIILGTKNRATAATGMNDKSSRSHSVFTIVLTQTRTERVENQDHDHSITSKINLVDLAGSERQSQAQTTGERLREGANINKSLLTLGKVISVLAERSVASKKRKLFIPYRDSVLTWLLKESLGGNSKTAMIATISPSHHHQEETLSTLRYARQTRSIVNVVRVNEDPKAKIIRELRAEIEKLRRQSGTMNEDSQMAGLAEIAMLREKLMSKEKEMDELSRSWQERLRQAEARKQEESKQLEKSGVAAVKVDNQLPNLVNLNEDPQLSELLLYVIKTGQTRVGRKRQNSSHDIQLNGALIADNHCIINNMEGIVNITPIGDAPTYVNGNLITDPTILHHADRVILGGDHYFRFNHPMEVKKNKKNSGTLSTEIKDFEFAKQELLRVQEAKLQAELQEAQRAAEAKMEEELERARREAEHELHQQRSGYEDKLANMEKTLKEQSLEVQKAEQSKQEAHSLIEDLRKQKMMLEQEVLAGRKRQQLEAEAAQRVNSELVNNKSGILELLEAERAKVALRLDELRQRRAEMTTPTRKRRGEGSSCSGTRKDLYKVALLLREANKISQYLKKNLVFSREDLDDEDSEDVGGTKTLIKVTNTHHGIFTHWTVAKLEEKVVQMIDLYQNDGDNSTDDDEVFNDPDDTWEKENPSPSNSPLVNGFYKSPVSSLNSRTSHLNSSATVSPATKGASFGVSSFIVHSDVSVYKACRKMVSAVMEQLNELSFEETVADKILWDCHILKTCVEVLLDGPDVTPSSATESRRPAYPPLQLVSGLQLLATHCSLWAASFDRDAPLVRDLLSQLTDQVHTVGVHVSHLLKGYETDLATLVQESAVKVSDEVLNVCRTCGQLSLATKTRIVRLEQYTQDSTSSQLCPEVCQAFLSGCDRLLDRTLQGGLKTLEQCETRANKLSASSSSKEVNSVCQDVSQTVLCTRVLLQACQDVQVEIDMSFTEGRESTSSVVSDHPSFFHNSYRRLQALLTHVSSLAETANLLIQCTEPLLTGDSQDYRRVHRCAELIHKRAQQLVSCSSSDGISLSSSLLEASLSPHSPHNTTIPDSKPHHKSLPSNLDSVSILSDSQVEHLDFAAQEVLSSSKSLMERITKLSSPQSAHLNSTPITPRGKRMLPVSPVKASASPKVHVQQASTRHNLSLATTTINC